MEQVSAEHCATSVASLGACPVHLQGRLLTSEFRIVPLGSSYKTKINSISQQRFAPREAGVRLAAGGAWLMQAHGGSPEADGAKTYSPHACTRNLS